MLGGRTNGGGFGLFGLPPVGVSTAAGVVAEGFTCGGLVPLLAGGLLDAVLSALRLGSGSLECLGVGSFAGCEVGPTGGSGARGASIVIGMGLGGLELG
jgi:hypothetical protein